MRRQPDKSGAFHSIGEFPPLKPKRMRTYEKLLAKLGSYEAITEAKTAMLMARLLKLV